MSDIISRLPDKILFRDPALHWPGYFILMKSIFVVDGVNTGAVGSPYANRCDNLTYNSTFVTHRSSYHEESYHAGDDIPVENFSAWLRVIDAAPDFCISFVALKQKQLDGSDHFVDYWLDGKPSTLWYGKSLIELFKNIREWSFMMDSPFDLDHPMAVHSAKVLEVLNPPQDILDELDNLPDMHLARFLKGDSNHRDLIEGFPKMSDQFKEWLEIKLEEFKPKTTNQRLLELEII
jgi:hypothetical protein